MEDFVGVSGKKYGRELLKEEVVVAAEVRGKGVYLDFRQGLAVEAILLLAYDLKIC